MERTRASLKTQAKASLKTNYWKLVLVSLIFLLIGGSISSPSVNLNLNKDVNYSDYYVYEDGYYNSPFDDDYYYNEHIDEGFTYLPAPIRFLSGAFSGIAGSVLVLLGLIGAAVTIMIFVALIALDILVLNPLKVGIHRFFLVNLHFPAQLRELAYSFDSNYWATVKTMFFRDLKIFLWSLLFVIPGIVKNYEYRMVPYLLAECPNMERQEVFAASASLMDGNKWRAFVLDLSFIGWSILSGITFGLVGLFFVNPYQNLTNAAFYQSVCQEKKS